MMKHSVCLVGCGRIGMLYDTDPRSRTYLSHAKAFDSHKAFSLDMMVDSDKKKIKTAKKMFPGTRCLQDYKEILSYGRPDLLIIAVPTQFHFQVLDYFIDKNIPLIACEKPLVENSGQFMEIKKRGKDRILVNYSRRFLPVFRNLRGDIASLKFGLPQKIVCWYSKGLRNNGSHMIDLIRFLFGEVRLDTLMVRSHFYDYSRNDPTVDCSFLAGAGKNPVPVYFCGCPETNFSIFELEMIFSNARITVRDFGRTIETFPVVNDPEYAGYRQLSTKPKIQHSDFGRIMLFFATYCRDLLGKREKNISDLENERMNMLFIEKVMERI